MLKKISTKEWAVKESSQVIANWKKFDAILDLLEEDTENAFKQLQSFIHECPEHIDAIHHLGMLHHEFGNLLEAKLLAKHAVDLVLKNLPQGVKLNKICLPWEALENRPFLRALNGYGIYLFESNDYEEAIHVFRTLITLNPNDNTGSRQLLVHLGFMTNDPNLVIELCNNFPDDWTLDITFGYPLALLQTNNSEKAKIQLIQAIKKHPEVAKKLIQNLVKSEDLSSGYISIGGNDDAFRYRQTYRQFWIETQGALELLKFYLDSAAQLKQDRDT